MASTAVLVGPYWIDGEGRWSGWIPLGGQFPAGSSVSAISRGEGRYDVFGRGMDNHLWQNFWLHPDTGDWSGWFRIDDKGVLDGAPAAVSDRPEVVHVFAVGTDQQAWDQYWAPDA